MHYLLQYLLLPTLYVTTVYHTPAKAIKKNYVYAEFNVKDKGLSQAAFDEGIKGLYYLYAKGKIRRDDYLTICDMSQSSASKRMYVLDLEHKKVVYNIRVAHGQGSGGVYANYFGNDTGSHRTSLGFYTTSHTYQGDNGYSLKLIGHEPSINNLAWERAIVLHGADYVQDGYYQANGTIGRSWGCPAVATSHAKQVINTIKNGTCVYLYHPSTAYHKKSKIV